MTFLAAVGQAQALDAREAGMQAAHQALNSLGTVTPALCVIIVPHRYDPQLVIGGVSSILSNVPMVGFSVSSGLTPGGGASHAVVVAMLGGESFQAETHWFPSYSQASVETASRIAQLLSYEQRPAEHILVFADGLNGSAEEFCSGLPAGLSVIGCLSSGDLQSANNFQIAGAQSGKGGLAAAFLRGNFKMGIGYGHGWHAVGSHFRVTRSRGFWLRTLDGRPASETYAQLFGHANREWAFPPLNYMCRIYPLGFEQEFSENLLVRAPLRVEADGSFRMNASVRDGSDAYLMVGSPTDCLNAARDAAQQALRALGDARPVFALVLADVAWQLLLQARPGEELQAIQDVLGDDVPIAGGYTMGQIIPPNQADNRSQFLNQHIIVIAFADKSA